VACWVVAVVCGIVVCGIVVCGIIGCGIVVCSVVVICGVVVGRVGSAIDREGCIVESGCSGGKGCDCVVVVVIIVVGSIDPGGEGWSGSCGGKESCDVVVVVIVVAGFAITGKSCSECSCRGAAAEGVGSGVGGVFGWFGWEKGCGIVGVGSCSNSQKLARILSQQVARALSNALSSVETSSR